MNKSLVLGLIGGIAVGVAIGSIALYTFTTSGVLQVLNGEKYTVRLTLTYNGRTTWYNILYQNGGTAVFFQNNQTKGEATVYMGNWTNVTLSKGEYTMKLFEGLGGTLINQRDIYVGKDLNITLDY